MRPEPRLQIRLGLAIGAAAIICVAIIAFVPDPLFQNTLFEASIDDADGITSGVPVSFMGGAVGKVRWVRLDTARSLYNVGLELRKDWVVPPCTVMRVAAANPLTAPKIEVMAPSQAAGARSLNCASFQSSIACTPIAPPKTAKTAIEGCIRQGDLTQLAARAITQATAAISQGQSLVSRLEALTGGSARPGDKPGPDLKALAANVTETTQSVNAIAKKLNATLSPERQRDLAATISNLRKVSGKAGDFDTASVQTTVQRTNALLEQTTAVLKENRESIQTLAAQGASATGEGRDALSGLQASMQATAANLERMSANLDAVTERVKGDPGSLVRGTRLADPPDPGARR